VGCATGRTLGSPLAVRIDNSEWPKWTEVMSPRPGRATRRRRPPARGVPLTRPRPGHADLTGMQKYGFDEARPVLERASRPRDRGPGGRRGGRQGPARQVGWPCSATWSGWGRWPPASRAVPTRPTCRDRRLARPLPGRGGRGADGGRGRRGQGGRATPWAGVFEVVATGLPPGLGLLRPVGPQAGRPPGRGADEHPGHQGGRGRRRLRGRRPPRVPGPRRHRPGAGTAPRPGGGAPGGPGGSRAA
jgi:chorismate synthase